MHCSFLRAMEILHVWFVECYCISAVVKVRTAGLTMTASLFVCLWWSQLVEFDQAKNAPYPCVINWTVIGWTDLLQLPCALHDETQS